MYYLTLEDFFFLGPISIFVLSGTIIVSAIIYMRNTNKIVSELRKTTSELGRGASELESITSELKKDTTELKRGTSELKESIDLWRRMMWWLPHE